MMLSIKASRNSSSARKWMGRKCLHKTVVQNEKKEVLESSRKQLDANQINRSVRLYSIGCYSATWHSSESGMHERGT